MTTKIPVELSSTPGIVDGSNATAITIDSSERVGIGCTPSAYTTEIQATSGGNALKLRGRSASENAGWLVWTNNADSIQAGMYATSNNLIFANTTGFTERMRIDSSGKVGIGTTSPSAPLTVSGADGTLAVFTNASDADFQFKTASAVAMITPSTGTLAFGTSNTERMRIDSSGNLSLGTTSHLNLSGSTVEFTIWTTGDTVNDGGGIGFAHNTSSLNSYILGQKQALGVATFGATYIYLATNNTERMRIDHNGDVQIGTTAQISSAKVSIQEASTSAGLFIRKSDGTTGTSNIYIGFDISGGGVTGGTITNSSAGNAQFTASSDERLKENIEDVTGCLDKVMALKPSSYTLKENKLDVPYGFIAQNVETVLPEFVSDDENGYKQISDGLTSGYIAVLTKAIQEQQTVIEDLKSRIETLEG